MADDRDEVVSRIGRARVSLMNHCLLQAWDEYHALPRDFTSACDERIRGACIQALFWKRARSAFRGDGHVTIPPADSNNEAITMQIGRDITIRLKICKQDTAIPRLKGTGRTYSYVNSPLFPTLQTHHALFLGYLPSLDQSHIQVALLTEMESLNSAAWQLDVNEYLASERRTAQPAEPTSSHVDRAVIVPRRKEQKQQSS